MALLEQHFEGQADGTQVTIANSTQYGDSALSLVDSTAGTVTYSTADAMHGSRSLRLAQTDTTQTNTMLRIGFGGFSSTNIAVRAYQKFTVRPTVPTRVMMFNGANGANLGGINIYPNGTFAVTDFTGAVLSQSSSSTQVVDLDTWYRIEMGRDVSTTVGSYKGAIYIGDSTTPWFSYTSAANMNTDVVAITAVYVGKASGTGPITAPWFVDDVAVNTTSSTLPGRYLPAGPSIATSLTPGLMRLDARSSTAIAGGALTYAISPSTDIVQSPNGVFYIPQGSTANAYTLSVTEAGRGTSSQVITIPALSTAASSQTTVMTQKWLSGAWR